MEKGLKMKIRWHLQKISMRRLMNLYYMHFITCSAFADLAAIVEDEKLRKFVIKAFLKEFTVLSLKQVLIDNGLWETE